MKTLFALLALSLSTVAFAEGEGSGNENLPVVTDHSVVGGGCEGRIVNSGNGENGGGADIVYSGTCNVARGSDNTVSDYYTVFPTVAAAAAHCNSRDWVAARYNWRGKITGYVCQEVGNSDGGNGGN